MAEDREFFEEIMRKHQNNTTVKEDRAFFEEVEKKYKNNQTFEEDRAFFEEVEKKYQNNKTVEEDKDLDGMAMIIERACGKINKIVEVLQERGINITPETIEQIVKDCQGLDNANKEIAKRIKKVCDKQQETNNKIKINNGISR